MISEGGVDMRIVLAYVIKPRLFCHTVVVGRTFVSFSTTHHSPLLISSSSLQKPSTTSQTDVKRSHSTINASPWASRRSRLRPMPNRQTFRQLTKHASHFGTLPPEIVDNITSYLDGRSLKSLRLVDGRNDAAIVRHLFSRIQLSALRVDRQSFIEIASRLDLARHVRELSWLVSPRPMAKTIALFRGRSYIPTADEVRVLTRQFGDACWALAESTTPDGFTYQRSVVRSAAWEAFLPELRAALGAMPMLDTLHMRPMDVWRPVGARDIDTVLGSADRPGEALRLGKTPMFRASGTYGFEQGLLCREIESRVRRRRPACEVVTAISRDYSSKWPNSLDTVLYRPLCGYDVENLTSVSVCIDPSLPSFAAPLVMALICAQGIDTLSITSQERFRNNTDPGSSSSSVRIPTKDVFLAEFQERSASWKNLTDLSFVGVEVSPAELARFVTPHAWSLSLLTFRECHTTFATLDALATVPDLHVASLLVVEPNAEVECDEEDALHMINEGPNQRDFARYAAEETGRKGLTSDMLVRVGDGAESDGIEGLDDADVEAEVLVRRFPT